MSVQVVWKVPQGESIVGLVEFRGRVFLATSVGLYELVGDDGPGAVVRRVPVETAPERSVVEHHAEPGPTPPCPSCGAAEGFMCTLDCPELLRRLDADGVELCPSCKGVAGYRCTVCHGGGLVAKGSAG